MRRRESRCGLKLEGGGGGVEELKERRGKEILKGEESDEKFYFLKKSQISERGFYCVTQEECDMFGINRKLEAQFAATKSSNRLTPEFLSARHGSLRSRHMSYSWGFCFTKRHVLNSTSLKSKTQPRI